jgi:hypothetical protein
MKHLTIACVILLALVCYSQQQQQSQQQQRKLMVDDVQETNGGYELTGRIPAGLGVDHDITVVLDCVTVETTCQRIERGLYFLTPTSVSSKECNVYKVFDPAEYAGCWQVEYPKERQGAGKSRVIVYAMTVPKKPMLAPGTLAVTSVACGEVLPTEKGCDVEAFTKIDTKTFRLNMLCSLENATCMSLRHETYTYEIVSKDQYRECLRGNRFKCLAIHGRPYDAVYSAEFTEVKDAK